MLTYTLNRSKGVCLYEELYRRIRQDIETGALSAGERLPSKRSLAEHLDISVVTVETAYEQLSAEGYIQCRPRSGCYVNALPAPMRTQASPPPHSEPSAPTYRMDLCRTTPEKNFPFTVWARLMRNTILEQESSFFQPPTNQGTAQLREAIADYLHRARGLEVSPAQIILGAGTEYLYQLLLLLLGRDRTYAIETPGYNTIARIYALNGVRFRKIPLDEQGLSASALAQSDADIVHISPAHHYPTGIVMPISRRQELLAWARQGDHYIIEDEYDSEFRFVGRPLPPLFTNDPDSRVLYMNTFSQTISPSIRISYLCLPPALMEEYQRKLGFSSCTVPVFEQLTLAKFLHEGYFERHLNRMKTYYRKKRKEVFDCIDASSLAPFIQIQEENAGLHFLVRLHTKRSDEEIRAKAASIGLRLSFLSEYYSAPPAEALHTLIINYSGIDMDQLPAVLEELAALLSPSA
jgi:GntR family transcriptional regulator/MocR family aminotransferase